MSKLKERIDARLAKDAVEETEERIFDHTHPNLMADHMACGVLMILKMHELNKTRALRNKNPLAYRPFENPFHRKNKENDKGQPHKESQPMED